MKEKISGCLIISLSLIAFSCESRAGTGALVGGAGGALIGGVAGGGTGALIGGAVGVVGGAVIGASMDEREKRKLDKQTLRQIEHTDKMTPKLLVKLNDAGVSKKGQIDAIKNSKPMYPSEDTMKYLRENGIDPEVREAVVLHYQNTTNNGD